MAKSKHKGISKTETQSRRPLSALLSQVLVAYTVEFDNEFERSMGEAGFPGAAISLTLWHGLMRFLTEGELTVKDLEERASAPATFQLGCLERWRFVTLQPDAADTRPVRRVMHPRAKRELRDGWGSGRGIRNEWIVRATSKGQKAIEIWPGLFPEIDQRWEKRFGAEAISGLREALAGIVQQSNSSLPATGEEPPGKAHLPALLARMLFAFEREFDRESKVPMWLCANTLRVLTAEPLAEREIPRLTGTSPETSGIGWQMKPFLVIAADPNARRGKAVWLNPRGLAAQVEYRRLVGEIEKRWEEKFGAQKVREVRERLEALFAARDQDGLLLAKGLVPPKGVKRSGELTPSLGAREPGVAAHQRIRDLVAQTDEFMRDPVNALPHFPLWDMNRGFGP
jgi:hypothetical protein